MKKLLSRHEELVFTLVALPLLLVVCLSYLSVRWVKEATAGRCSQPALVALHPLAVTSGVKQRVTLLADRSHFGPETVVLSDLDGVYASSVGFANEREVWFDVVLRDDLGLNEGDAVPLRIRSPLAGGGTEEIELRLSHTEVPAPLELDLFNFHGESEVTVKRGHVVFGYSPHGYAPFNFKATQLETTEVWEQRTEAEVEQLGVPLEVGLNPFELELRDALGREVRKQVLVRCEPDDGRALLASFNAGLTGGYDGKPVQWNADPTAQVAAADCALGNGPLSCGSAGCGRGAGAGILPPPNDYVTGLGEAVAVADGVLLHRGSFCQENIVDMVIPGRGLDFAWSRSYDSSLDLDGYLGKNWDFSFAAQFVLDNPTTPQTGKFSRGDCRRDLYSGAVNQGGVYRFTVRPAGYYDIDCYVYSGQVTQIKRNGFKQVFDATTSLLKSREDRYGNKITVIYDYAGDLSRVRDTLSRDVEFFFGTTGAENGRLTKVRDFAGRELRYEFDYAWSGGPVVLTKVSYPATDWTDDTTTPWTTKTATSRAVTYRYASGLLATMVDSRGQERWVNEYDLSGRVTKQYNFVRGAGAPYQELAYTLVSGKVNEISYKTRELNETVFYFDTTNHLSTRIDVKYTSEGSPATATSWITRGCGCTLPTAVQEPDNGYTTWTIDSATGNVTEVRQYADYQPPYTTTAGSDLVRKAYYAPISSTQFGVVTRVVGPKAFTATPDENKYATDITYDTKGNPLTIQFPSTSNPTQQNVREFRTYNSYGQLLTVSAEEGRLTQLTYYASGDTPASNLGYLKEHKVKYGLDGGGGALYLVTTCTWSNFGALTKVRDPLGRETNYVVDAEFLVKSMTSPTPFSYITQYSYNGNRQRLKEELQNRKGTDPADSSNPWWETQYIYDSTSQLRTLQREISQSGSTVTWQETKYDWDDDFRLTKVTDPEANPTLFELDERGLRTRVRSAYGSADESVVEQVFDGERKLTKSKQAFRNPGDTADTVKVSRRTYDVFDRLEYTYDGESDAVADNFSHLFYDLASFVTKLDEYAAGAAEGTDPPLRRNQFEFDERDRRTKVKRGVSSEDQTTFEYDRAERLTKVTDDNANVRLTEYDYADRVTKQVSPSLNGQASGENHVTLAYDLSSNVTQRTSHEVDSLDLSAVDLVWEMQYDELNRRTLSTFKGSDGATGSNPVDTVNTLDTRNLVIQRTDADGVPAAYEYDGLGRLTRTRLNAGGTNPSEIVVQAAYDKVGNVTSRTDAASHVTSYAFDDQNRLAQVTHADGDWQAFEYNDLSQPSKRRYGNGGSTYLTLEYHYNLRGLYTKKKVLWADPPTWTDYDAYKTTEEVFAYDGLYRLTDADDDDTEVTLVWNALDQVTQERQKIKTGGSWTGEKTVASAWDDTGKRRTSVTYPISGKTFGCLYDALDRMTTLELSGSPAKPMASYGYEGPGGRVVRRDRAVDLSATGFGTVQHRAYFSYDALERLTKIEHKKATKLITDWVETVERTLDSTWGNGSTGRIWQRGSYDIADATSTLVQHDYAYDKVGRLVEDKRQVGTNPVEDFDYTQEATQFLKERKKDSVAEVTYTEAGDGSLQVASYNDGSTATLVHDVSGNVASRTQSGSTTSYFYDHENRLAHIDAGTDFWFRYDALGRRVEEKEGTAVKLFWYDGVHIAEETDGATPSPALQRLSLFGPQIDEVLYSGALDGSQNLTDHRWPLADHLGSVLVVVDNGGTVKTDFNYTTAYGETTRTGAESYPYGYTGRRWIETANVYDYRTRAYNPNLGRFLQRDSIGVWGDGGNLGNGYGYVGNDPVDWNDPAGEVAAAAAPAVGVAVGVIGRLAGWAIPRILALLRRVPPAIPIPIMRDPLPIPHPPPPPPLPPGVEGEIGGGAGALGISLALAMAAEYAAMDALRRNVWPRILPFPPPPPPPLPQSPPDAARPRGDPPLPPFGLPMQPGIRLPNVPVTLPAAAALILIAVEFVDEAYCGARLIACLLNPWQPDWNQELFGIRKYCQDCVAICMREGFWPDDKCPP